MNNDILAQFSAVWNRFASIPLPRFLKGAYEYEEEDSPELARGLLPIVGTIIGFCVVIPSYIVGMLFGRVPEAVICGAGGAFLLEFMTSWRGSNALAAYIIRRKAGATQDEAMELDPPSLNSSVPAVSLITLMVIWIIKAILLAVLASYGSLFWIIVSMTVAYFVRAELTSLKETGSLKEFYETPEKNANLHYYTTVIIILAVSIGSWGGLAGAALAFGTAWGISKYATALITSVQCGINSNIINIFGSASEIFLLLIGVFLYAGSWR